MSEAYIIQEPAFNPNLFYCGVAVRLDGFDFDGELVTGNYIVEKIDGVGTLNLVGVNRGNIVKLAIDIEDINNGLKLSILHDVK